MIAQAVVISFTVSLCCLLVLLSRHGRALVLDHPNERSLHERPVPRTGGIAVLAGAAAAIWPGAASLWLPLTLALGLAVISLVDDVFGMPALVRLTAHFAAAGILVWDVLSPLHAVALITLAVAVAWTTNLFNFMDGADGLAGGMAVMGFGTYALASSIAGNDALAVLCAAIAAGAAAFLLQNFHPARIFLGDVGSVPLGFFAGALGVLGWREDAWPLWFPLLVFGPFVGDATLTLLRRLAKREPVWRPHREHYYQRMVRMGFGHRGTAGIAYGVMLVCAACALYGRNQPVAVQLTVFAGGSAFLVAFAAWVDLRWARFSRASGDPA